MNPFRAQALQYSALRILAESRGTMINASYRGELASLLTADSWRGAHEVIRDGDTVMQLPGRASALSRQLAQWVGSKGRILLCDERPFDTESLEIEHQIFLTRFQNLKIDGRRADSELSAKPIQSWEAMLQYQKLVEELAEQTPLFADESVEVVVSALVTNQVPAAGRASHWRDIWRVLKKDGRAIAVALVSDEELPPDQIAVLQERFPDLASVPTEGEFFAEVTNSGLYGIKIGHRADLPTMVVGGVELRLVTISAYKGKEGPCLDKGQAVIYRGPWSRVYDDDGHVYVRGERTAVCAKTFKITTSEPYAADMIPVEAYMNIPDEAAALWDCGTPQLRDPQETKGVVPLGSQKPSTSSCC